MIAKTHPVLSVREAVLFVAFELSRREWKIALTSGFGVAAWVRTIAAGDLGSVTRVIAQGRARFGLDGRAPVVSCYEAGREGFWIHRALVARGIANRVVDSSSIEVNRRARRAKTDRIDAIKLVQMLVRAWCGERTVWREVRVPTAAAEAARQVSRERTALTRERTRLLNQLRGWLATWGTTLPTRRGPQWWAGVRDWAGTALPAPLQRRLARASERLALVETQRAALDTAQREHARTAPAGSPLARLVQLKGVAATSAAVLLDEGLLWREFRNRREIGGVLGFTPTPYASGDATHEQGISRAGNNRLQVTSIQLAWSWVHWQPQSALSRWYHQRFGVGKRARRIGIVALARKLVIALWRYATTGVVPTGALLKVA
jgi:transposase